jgi:metal-dependent amidase/aminoacylase/carboxypeptidase family protein
MIGEGVLDAAGERPVAAYALAGPARNVIPDTARFEVTARSFSAAARSRLRDATLQLVQGIAGGHGLTAEARYSEGYPGPSWRSAG